MSDVTLVDLALYRRRWVRTLIDTYSFGIYTVMVIMTLYYLFRRGNAWSQHRLTISYTIAMFCITVAWYYSQTRIDEALTIETLAGPDVSSQISVGESCGPLDNASSTLSTLQFWGNDILMLSRAYVIFERRPLVMLVPTAMFLAFVALGLILIAACSPNMAPSVLAHMNSIFVANYAMSAAFNILITGMIATKLFWHRRRMQLRSADVFDGAVGDVYISAIGVLAESAGLYCVAVISYVALFTRHSQEVYWFSAVLMSSSFLTQAWIILRISMGSTYIQSTRASFSTVGAGSMVFARPMPTRRVRTRSEYSASVTDLDNSIPLEDMKV